MPSHVTLTHLMIPLAFIAGGILAGLLLEKFLLPRLRKLADRTVWTHGSRPEGDEIFLSSLKGSLLVWLFLGGIYGALLATPMGRETSLLLQKALLAIMILSVTLYGGRVGGELVELYLQKAEGAFPSSLFKNLSGVVVYVVGILVILQTLGISITPILTALGVGGLAVALALQETLSNLFSGIHLLASRQIKSGDYVELDSGQKGYVEDITWRSTVIRTLSGNLVIIPNKRMATATITNYGLPAKEMAVLVEVGVGYGNDLEKVEATTIEVAKEVMREVPGGVPEFEPFVRYQSFGEFSINLTVIMRGREFVDQYPIKHEFVKRLHRRYGQEGIKIELPVRRVFLREE